jgi:hypothetical protein
MLDRPGIRRMSVETVVLVSGIAPRMSAGRLAGPITAQGVSFRIRNQSAYLIVYPDVRTLRGLTRQYICSGSLSQVLYITPTYRFASKRDQTLSVARKRRLFTFINVLYHAGEYSVRSVPYRSQREESG